MQQYTDRLRWAVLPVAVRMVGVVTLSVVVLSLMALHSLPHARAMGLSRVITGTASSSPSSGPVGTTITVSGSGWGGTDGTSVSFGYEANSGGNTFCQVVSDSQNSSLSGGNFSGWFRWPSGTALNTYSVCALVGSVMATAGSFNLLSSNPPGVSISPSALTPKTPVTITASNYYPAGTQVNFYWMSGNIVIENLNSATSNTGGVASVSFVVPDYSITNGQYSLAATTGGQPATLFSSTNFTYSTTAVSPSPTPRPSPSPKPSPSPSPTMTPSATPMTTPTVTPTTTASATVATATPTVGASPTVGNGQTPTTNSTHTGNSGNNTSTSTSNSPPGALLFGGVALLLGALLAAVVALLLLRRRGKAADAAAKGIPPTHPPGFAQGSWAHAQNLPRAFMNNGAVVPPLNSSLPTNGSVPGNFNPAAYAIYNTNGGPGAFTAQTGNMPTRQGTLAPVPVGAGNGSTMTFAGHDGPMSSVPLPMPPPPLPPPSWLAGTTSNGNMPPTAAITGDPALDALRQQVQAGMYVAPMPFKDERSQ